MQTKKNSNIPAKRRRYHIPLNTLMRYYYEVLPSSNCWIAAFPLKLSKMLANSTLISSNFSSLLFFRNKKVATTLSFPKSGKIKNPPKTQFFKNPISGFGEKGRVYVCHSSLKIQDQEDPSMEKDVDGSTELGGGSNNGDRWDWTTSFVLFGLWSGLMCYVFFLAPNQTPVSLHILLLNILFFWFLSA